MNCGIAAREGALGYDPRRTVCKFIGNIYLVGEHSVLHVVVKRVCGRSFAQAPVALRANNVRPYGYACADGFTRLRRGRRTLR